VKNCKVETAFMKKGFTSILVLSTKPIISDEFSFSHYEILSLPLVSPGSLIFDPFIDNFSAPIF